MQEFRISYSSEKHSAMLNGQYLDDSTGEAMPEFPVMVEEDRISILDIISNATMCYVATFLLSRNLVNLVLNEENGQLYSVEYSRIHHTHTFPTEPRVTIDLVDFD